MKRLVCSIAILALSAAFPVTAQDAAKPCSAVPVSDHGQAVNGQPLASPPAVAETTLAGKKITIKYNAPSMRCRTIMGELVPYGKVWRTGANPATTLVTETALKIGTLTVPAGTYTIYTLPEAPGKAWSLIVNKQTGQWGTVYDERQDLGRTPMKGAKITPPQETMSIGFEKVSGKKAELHIKWETTNVSVRVVAE